MSASVDLVTRLLAFGHRDTGGPLQQARATTAIGWMLALGLAVALFMHPLVLCVLLLVICLSAWRSRVLGPVLVALLISLPLSLLIAIVNPVASQQGLTVLLADLHLPLLGSFDVTREAVLYGLILGLRTATLLALCALYVSCVSPDELLRVLRRHSVRSAITASLSVRFVPTLARDGANLAAARACRPGSRPSSTAVVRAVFARSLERAGDSALALETRGFALARPLKETPPPRREVDQLLILSGLLVAALAVAAEIAGVASFAAYPTTAAALGPEDIAFTVLLGAVALLPNLAPRRSRP